MGWPQNKLWILFTIELTWKPTKICIFIYIKSILYLHEGWKVEIKKKNVWYEKL